jgi:hypothetical protein
MKTAYSSHSQIVTSAIVVSLMMLAFGCIHRAVTSWYGTSSDGVRLGPRTLESISMQIGDWTGENIPLDKLIIEATDSDSLINRRYSRDHDMDSVSLYVVCGANGYDVMQHRPPGCYVAAGMTYVGRQPVELQLGGGATLPCSIYEFVRSDAVLRRYLVLHYIIVDGKCFADVSPSLLQETRLFRRVGYVAQVQIGVLAQAGYTAYATKIITEFAIVAAPEIDRVCATLNTTGHVADESL